MAAESGNPTLLEAVLFVMAVGAMFMGRENPLWLSATFLCCAVMFIQRPEQRSMGVVVLLGAVVYFAVVSWYDIGKDMALRDNAKPVASVFTAGSTGPG